LSVSIGPAVSLARRSRRAVCVRLLLIAVLLLLGLRATAAWSATGDVEEPRDFEPLWQEARRLAAETRAVADDCIVSLRFDPATRLLRSGHTVTCEEPYRSPFYPWPEESRPGVRFSAGDVERYARRIGIGTGRYGRRSGAANDPLESCGLVVGFTDKGEGAAAIECYQPQGNVLGQRANTEIVVTTPDDRHVVSRLYERISHLVDDAVRQAVALPAIPDGAGEVMVQIDGKVVARDRDRLLIRGRALPSPGVPQTKPGVLMSDASIVVQHPSDDALRPGYYFAGDHCFKEVRQVAIGPDPGTVEWVYGPCPLGPDWYWVFEQHPLGERTVVHGPYGEYAACDGDRKSLKQTRSGVGGHCVQKSKAVLRMRRDGTLVVPKNAPAID